MNKDGTKMYPSWFDIKNWEEITSEKADFIHSQATLCYSDQLDGYKALKARCQALFMLLVTLLSALVSFLANHASNSTKINEPEFVVSITFGVCLILSILCLWKNMFGQTVDLQGQEPSKIFNKDFIEGHPYENLVAAEIMTIQQKIDNLRRIKSKIRNSLKVALSIFGITPIISSVVLLIWFF